MAVLRTELESIERAHTLLRLTYREIAATIKADESTIHRWRSGESEPSPVFVGRLEALDELLREVARTFRSDEAAHRWLDQEAPALGNRRPRELLLEGRIERVTSLLTALNLGAPV